MNQVPTSGGMSQGMKITLIIIGVFLGLIIIATATCYVYRDDIVQYSIVTLVNGLKAEVASNPSEGIDTVSFNRVADGFVKHVNSPDFDLEAVGALGLSAQGVLDDKKIDADEVERLVEAMIAIYPDLAEPEEGAAERDSLERMTDSVESL